jgi:hypothetical protein
MGNEKTPVVLKERFTYLRKVDQPKATFIFFTRCGIFVPVILEMLQSCVTMRLNVDVLRIGV